MDNITPKILTLPEAAEFLRVSTSWLARKRNWTKYGGVKEAGKILFPGEKELYDRIFHNNQKENQRRFQKGQGMAVRLPLQKETISKSELRDKDSSERGGRSEKGEVKDTIDYSKDIFNLLGTRK